jgi:RNA polymerase sigma factor (sigma-70 family)
MGETVPDQQLLDLFILHKDTVAFAALMQRYGPLVLNVCRRQLRDRHAVEDAFQATFLVLFSKAAAIRKHESLAAWLHGVAYRVARRAQVGAHTQPLPAMPSATADPSEVLHAQELAVILDDELHELPAQFQAPLVLCYMQGLTRDEAAAQLGWSLRRVKLRLEQGRTRLRDRLTRRGVELAACLAALELSVTPAPAALLETTFQVVQATAPASAGANLLLDGVLEIMTTTSLSWLHKLLSHFLLPLALLVVAFGLAIYAWLAKTHDPSEEEECRKEIAALHNAVAAFSTDPRFGSVGHLPSRIDPSGSDPASADYLRRMFPRTNGQLNLPSVQLEGDQCLVFFLGGPNNRGWSMDPLDPTSTYGNRIRFYEFRPDRLQDVHGNGYPSYLDAWGTPTAFFSSTGWADGQWTPGKYTDDCPLLMLKPYRGATPGSWQIISAGRDRKFGQEGDKWALVKPPIYRSGSDGYDDITNFTSRNLGAAKE